MTHERAGVYLTNALTGWEPMDPEKEKAFQAMLTGFPQLLEEQLVYQKSYLLYNQVCTLPNLPNLLCPVSGVHSMRYIFNQKHHDLGHGRFQRLMNH